MSLNSQLGHQLTFYLLVQHIGSRILLYSVLLLINEALLVCKQLFYSVDNKQCICCFHDMATDNYNGDTYILSYCFQLSLISYNYSIEFGIELFILIMLVYIDTIDSRSLYSSIALFIVLWLILFWLNPVSLPINSEIVYWYVYYPDSNVL
jgi:hypothetical protein